MSGRPDLDRAPLVAEYLAGCSANSLTRKYSANIWSILTRLRKAGVRIRSSKEQNERRLNLSSTDRERLVEIVDGLLLGDGTLDPKGSLRLEQARVRKGWIDQVEAELRSIGVSCRVVPIPPRTRFLEGRRIRSMGGHLLYTPCYVELKPQRARWYRGTIKHVPFDVRLTPLSIAHWFSGDGSGSQGSLFFYTNCFTKREVSLLVRRIVALGVLARVRPASEREGEWTIIIGRRDDAHRLKMIIEQHVPDCCLYKLRDVRPHITSAELSALRKSDRPKKKKT